MEVRGESYRYSTWTDITNALYPALHEQGLAFMPLSGRQGDQFVMMGMLVHAASGQWISSTCPIRDVVSEAGIRGDSQSFEIATTYAKKTLLKSMAGGWEVGDERDAQEAAVEQVQRSEEELALLQKIESQLTLVRNVPSKLRPLLARVGDLVAEGRLSEADGKRFHEEFPIPEKKKECAVAQ